MKPCQWVVGSVGVLYLVALALLLIGTFGLFGQERDPLPGIFPIPLAMPWVSLLEGLSDSLKPWFAALSPLLNIVILAPACRYVGRRKNRA